MSLMGYKRSEQLTTGRKGLHRTRENSECAQTHMKNNPPIRIRHAYPDDASFLATSALIAGRAHVHKGIWEVILGGSEEECLDFLHHISVTTVPHLFHYSCYFIAEYAKDRPVGSLGGYDSKQLGHQALQLALGEVVKKLNLTPQAFQEAEERSSKMLICLPKEIDGAWVIDSVATLPQYRKKGIAEKLMEHVLHEGKERGYTMAQINMYIGNEPALNLYKKMGFEVIEEKRDEYFERTIGSPGMLSLARTL
jgi:ribosomal protein S18 acetylase RimI-like enzyme